MKKIVAVLLLLCLSPLQIVKAENQDNTIIIQKSGQSQELAGELKLNDVENAYPGYQFPEEKFLLVNKTGTPQALSISLVADSGIDKLNDYFEGEIVVTRDTDYRKEKFTQLPLLLTEKVAADETVEMSMVLGIKGETPNEVQNQKGKLLWEISVAESSSPVSEKSEESKGKLPATGQAGQFGLIFLGMFLSAVSISRRKLSRFSTSENKKSN